jgi:hypothetical protein
LSNAVSQVPCIGRPPAKPSRERRNRSFERNGSADLQIGCRVGVLARIHQHPPTPSLFKCFVSGHNFTTQRNTLAEPRQASGHDLSRAAQAPKTTWALAPARYSDQPCRNIQLLHHAVHFCRKSPQKESGPFKSRTHSIFTAMCEGARLQSCQKHSPINRGFSPRGKESAQ